MQLDDSVEELEEAHDNLQMGLAELVVQLHQLHIALYLLLVRIRHLRPTSSHVRAYKLQVDRLEGLRVWK